MANLNELKSPRQFADFYIDMKKITDPIIIKHLKDMAEIIEFYYVMMPNPLR